MKINDIVNVSFSCFSHMDTIDWEEEHMISHISEDNEIYVMNKEGEEFLVPESRIYETI